MRSLERTIRFRNMDLDISEYAGATYYSNTTHSDQSLASLAPSLELRSSVSPKDTSADSTCTSHPPAMSPVCIDIEADVQLLLHPGRFKKAVGPLGPESSKSRIQSRLRDLMDAFLLSDAGSLSQSRRYLEFEKHLKDKYRRAIALYCLDNLEGTDVGKASERSSQSLPLDQMEQYLKSRPGVVYVWADSADMQALCIPRGPLTKHQDTTSVGHMEDEQQAASSYDISEQRNTQSLPWDPEATFPLYNPYRSSLSGPPLQPGAPSECANPGSECIKHPRANIRSSNYRSLMKI